MARSEARFVSGSTLRHVTVMAVTGSLGLMFVFLVDAAAVFWVAQIGDPRLVAALGFAWTIQFFSISFGIGLMIGALALVSRAFGADDVAEGRRLAATGIVLTVAVQAVVAALAFAFRRELLFLAGAEAETAEIAARYLMISIPSLPLMAIGIVASAVLRAAGDAMRSMMVTVSAGCVAMVMDPVFIVWLGWGTDGAAFVIFLSRTALALVGLYLVVRVRDLAASPSLAHIRRVARPFLLIAVPAVATQLASPAGNFIVTYYVARFGDEAVAGWAVVARIMVFAFGGLFALSGAIGGIFGQNYGAGRIDRVQRAYRDALVFCVAYVGLVWMIFLATRGVVVRAFGLVGGGTEVAWVFMTYASVGFLFLGGLFVASAAFNTMGRPMWSTWFNWLRDVVLLLPLCAVLTLWYAAPGAILAQIGASVIGGTVAVWAGWRYVGRLQPVVARP